MYRFIPLILTFGYINIISSESISNQAWSNLVQDLSLKIHDYKSDEKTIENYPLNEGFIILSDTSTKSSATKPTRPSIKNRISSSQNISTTTCTTVIIAKTTKHTSPSIGHLGRRLLNEPSYDTDIDATSIQTPIEDDGEIDSFLKVDDEELSKHLLRVEATYGSGTTEEDTTEQTSEMTTTTLRLTTTTTSLPLTTSSTTLLTTTTAGRISLSNYTTFILIMNCTNANTTLNDILTDLSDAFHDVHNWAYNHSELLCNNDTEKANLTLNFNTDNNVTILNRLFEYLKNAATPRGVEIFSINKCGSNEILSVSNDDVTSCYLIDKCHLCGERGECQPEKKLSRCRCFADEDDISQRYVGEFCEIPETTPIKSQDYPSRWTPIIVGVLAGLTGLFCAITCCLWVVALWRRRRYGDDLRVHRIWHLPRAQFPTSVTNENVQTYLNSTISTTSSHRTNSDYNRSDTTDSTFFKELDQKMGENLRATITRPNTEAMLASLPSDTISTLSSYDPIDELDSIIDHEDINATFHDPLNELYEDNEILEVINPNLKLPRPNVDSKPTGLFSLLYNKF